MAAAAFGVFFLAFFAAMIAGLVFWIMKIVEVAQIPDAQYRAAGTDKTVWVLVVVLLGWIGALIWQFAKRDEVLRARGLLGSGGPGYLPGPGYGPGYGAGYGPGPAGPAYAGAPGQAPGHAATPPAGWYPEPGTGWFAYWDGYRWTGARQPPQQQAPQQPGPSLHKRTD
jgi:hypothetical protein